MPSPGFGARMAGWLRSLILGAGAQCCRVSQMRFIHECAPLITKLTHCLSETSKNCVLELSPKINVMHACSLRNIWTIQRNWKTS